MAKYATVENGETAIHNNLALDKAPDGSVPLSDEEYAALAIGTSKLVDGKVVPV